MSTAFEAAADAANDLLVADDEATDEVEQPEASAVDTPVVQHEAEPLPDELREELETPDFNAEAEAELEAVEPEYDDEYEDDATRELRKKLAVAEKKAAFLEQQRLNTEKPRWKAEAEKYFPYADLDGIDATSRRGFLKAAKAEHERVAATVEKAVAAKLGIFDPDTEREKIRAEEKKRLEEAWGTPTVNTTQAPAEAKENAEAVDKAIQSQGLAAGILEMFKQQQ